MPGGDGEREHDHESEHSGEHHAAHLRVHAWVERRAHVVEVEEAVFEARAERAR